MLDPSFIESYLRQLKPEQLHSALAGFFPASATQAERTKAIETALGSAAGPVLRAEMGRWIVEKIVPVEVLVPAAYANWRPPVRDAMLYVVSRLSDARLAPKLLEQIELPLNTPHEDRLLRLIAKVPGLQKLGQVLARNQALRPSLRNALAELESGIHDVNANDIQALIRKKLGSRLEAFAVQIDSAILSEASVSAVMGFTWVDPATGQRERGVFKVLKPYIPVYFAEDMDMLQGLAAFFASKHREYGFARHVLTDVFGKVRVLLQHEVDFPREQRTLAEACDMYRSIYGIRVPRLIRPLCARNITAMTEEQGVKVTEAVTHIPAWRRPSVAGQLIDALVTVPLFAADERAIFHADPHAGNLHYNYRSGELILLDWALTEHLTREQRRHLALFFLMMALRDPVGLGNEVRNLSQQRISRQSSLARVVRDTVVSFLDEMPLNHVPTPVDAMLLLERMAAQGVRFPASLIMFSKVLFTLHGILGDIGGSDTLIGVSIARHLAQRWLADRNAFGWPLLVRDWVRLQGSALLYGSRMMVRGEQALLNRLLPAAHETATAP